MARFPALTVCLLSLSQFSLLFLLCVTTPPLTRAFVLVSFLFPPVPHVGFPLFLPVCPPFFAFCLPFCTPFLLVPISPSFPASFLPFPLRVFSGQGLIGCVVGLMIFLLLSLMSPASFVPLFHHGPCLAVFLLRINSPPLSHVFCFPQVFFCRPPHSPPSLFRKGYSVFFPVLLPPPKDAFWCEGPFAFFLEKHPVYTPPHPSLVPEFFPLRRFFLSLYPCSSASFSSLLRGPVLISNRFGLSPFSSG